MALVSPSCPIDDLALHEAEDVLKLLLPAGEGLWDRGHVQPEGEKHR